MQNIIDEETSLLFTICKSCETRKYCNRYDINNELQRCSIEKELFIKNYNEIVNSKKIDPSVYGNEIKELCMLNVRLWRRRNFEACFGTQMSDMSRSSSESSKLENTIIKLQRILGIDRRTNERLKVKELPEVTKETKITQVFNQIQNIIVGELRVSDKEREDEIVKFAEKRVEHITSLKNKQLEFDDLKFKELGFNDITKIPKMKKKEDEKHTSKNNEEIIDIEKFPLVKTDDKKNRYIPKR